MEASETIVRQSVEKTQLDRPNASQLIVARAYSLRGLPVWSEDGKKCDASILIALIKSKVIPGKWNDGENKISSVAEKTLLNVDTTLDAHKAIVDVLEELRQPAK